MINYKQVISQKKHQDYLLTCMGTLREKGKLSFCHNIFKNSLWQYQKYHLQNEMHSPWIFCSLEQKTLSWQFNPLPHNPKFWQHLETRKKFLKTMLEKEKMIETSISSLPQNVFYHIKDRSITWPWSVFILLSANVFNLVESQILLFWY